MPGELFHSFIQDGNGWATIRRDVRFDSPHVQVYAEEMRTPSRPQGVKWTVVHRKGAVVIAPFTAEGRLLLVRQERIPIRATIWEFPAGQIDSATEQEEAALRETALRELREETGYELPEGGAFLPMGHFFPSPGFTDEHSHLFLARGVVPSAQGPQYDENEMIHECRPFAPEELRGMIAKGEIRDANTLAAFARMTALGLI